MMLNSSLDLNNSDLFRRDDKGKSLAYFCTQFPIKINETLIAELKEISSEIGDKNVRLCMHSSPESSFHNMLILEKKGKYYPPHKHKTKGESFHLIEGRLAVFAFNETGEIIDACVLENGGHFIYKVGVNMYHAVMPLSDVVIYHESKPGPFLGDQDSIVPDWAPNSKQEDEMKNYENHLLHSLKTR